MSEELKTISLDIPVTLAKEIEDISSQLGKSKTEILTDALNMYMDYHDLQFAVESAKDPNDRPLTADEFFDDLDI
jgi:predicted DNA-binding protein